MPVALAPKVFETLLVLIENHGRIVLKEELMKRLWPDTFVEEANLTFNVQQPESLWVITRAARFTFKLLRVADIALLLR